VLVDLIQAAILGVVEGLTEFVPVSSTGHLIVVGYALGFTGEKAATFEVFIQLGAILAVVLIYRRRLLGLLSAHPGSGFAGRRGLMFLALTTMPALAAGAIAGSAITDHLFAPSTVAIGWGVGGAALLGVERVRPIPIKHDLDELGWRDAVVIGLSQCLALWPGMSRSATTIGSGMLLGLSRQTAAEYSFLAAVPVLTAASSYELLRNRHLLQADDVPVFATGLVVSFVAAWFAIRVLLRILSISTLRPFGWYRLAAAALLGLVLLGNQISP
jgi:undecaprenyl-diphosphatase